METKVGIPYNFSSPVTSREELLYGSALSGLPYGNQEV